MLIIGYDDTTQAVLIQNSFGSDWGEATDMSGWPTRRFKRSRKAQPSTSQRFNSGSRRTGWEPSF